MNRKDLSSKEIEIAEHIKGIMNLLDLKETSSNFDTPYRIAKMYTREVFGNRSMPDEALLEQMTFFKCPDGSNNTPITMKGIKFNSMCEHHWLPFFGEVEISYSPNMEIVGLSKLPRVVKWFSKKPQTQENMTSEIGDFLVQALKPHSLTVKVKATHTCVTCRGIESEGTETETVFHYSNYNDF